MPRTLAVDLGTTCGWALSVPPGTILSGNLKLAPKKREPSVIRFVRFADWLREQQADVVLYEDVKRHAGTQAAHIYGGFKAILQAWCFDRKIECHGVGVGTIKKFWCRTGAATKSQIIAECVARGFTVVDDNEADALALLHYGLTMLELPSMAAGYEIKPRVRRDAAA